ncbi:MAG: methyltransferase domain-containing protein [Phreatobacter sp.]|uniref:methyltransferase domain-containing protein n=1 Tax=Phreatobacter sp. TaxID=1966341 RepID=UPI0040350277
MSILSLIPRAVVRPAIVLANGAEVEDGGNSTFSQNMPDSYGVRRMMRKWWEWDYISGCVDALSAAGPGKVALGLGCGNEPLIFHFANQFGHTIATDLYSSDTAWQEARTESINALYDTAPFAFDRSRLEIMNCDMRTLTRDTGSVDLVWSTSSIEHVDGLEDLWAVYAEIWRVLKPGGYAVLTTEFCLTEPPYLLPGVNAMDASLLPAIALGNGGFEFVGPVSFDYNWAYPANTVKARRYKPTRLQEHAADTPLALYRQGEIANPVGISAITPVGFVLRKTERAFAPWEDCQVDPHWRRFSALTSRCARRDFPRVAADHLARRPDIFADHLDPGDPRNTMQVRMHALRYQADSLANDPLANQRLIKVLVEKALDWLPEGPVQDPDVLDLLAYLWRQAGNPKGARDLLMRAIWAPGASSEHVVKLSVDLAVAGAAAGSPFEDALETAALAVADLMLSGTSRQEIQPMLGGRLADSGLSRQVVDRLEDRIRAVLLRQGEMISASARSLAGVA